MFFILEDVDFASYADDNTPYVTEEGVDQVTYRLENSAKILFQWFRDNEMKSNADKFHFLLCNEETSFMEAEGNQIKNTQSEKLLGVSFDANLSFNLHLDKMCKKASQKLNALARLIPQMSINKRKILINRFLKSFFNYCPLVWMCHNRCHNNRIDRLHERSLRMV